MITAKFLTRQLPIRNRNLNPHDESASRAGGCPAGCRVCGQRSLTKIHLVLFVIPVDRLSKSLLVELEKMFQALAEWGMQPGQKLHGKSSP